MIGWLLDTLGASYFATTQRRVMEGEEEKDLFVVAKTRGGKTWLRRAPCDASEPRWDVPLGESNAPIWFVPTWEVAAACAKGYNRSLSIRRRGIILAVGFGTTLGLRLAGIGLI